MSIRPAVRSSLFVVMGLAVVLTGGCASDGGEGQTEPVAPADEITPYPEDPDMAKADGESTVPSEASPDDEPVGELTDDPFDNTAPLPMADDTDVPAAEDGLAEPDSGEPYGGAFEDKRPEFEPSPDGPSVTPPDIGDDMVAPTPDVDSDMSTDAPAVTGKQTRYVDAILLNVRSRASQKAPIVRRLLGGAKVHVELHGGWAKLKDGQWVRSSYLKSSPTRKVSRTEAEKAWRGSRYKDTWKPGRKK